MIRYFTPLLILLSISATKPATPLTPVDLGKGRQPRVVISGDESTYAVFGGDDGIDIKRSTDFGQTWLASKLIAPLSGKFALGMRRGPRVCSTAGAVVVTAVIYNKGAANNGNLVAVRSNDGGTTWSAPATVCDAAGAAREGLDGLASDGKNRVAAVWLDLRDKNATIMCAVSGDQGKSWSKNVLVYRSPDIHVCECCHPSVLFTPDGAMYVMFRNWLSGNRDMYLATSNDFGKTWTTAKLGNGSWQLDACPMDGGELTSTGGRIDTVWLRDKKVYSDSPGKPETTIANGRQPTIASTKAGVWIAYLKGDELHVISPDKSDRTLAQKATDPELYAAGEYVACVWQSNGHSFFARLK